MIVDMIVPLKNIYCKLS